jgi:hypothetical protein
LTGAESIFKDVVSTSPLIILGSLLFMIMMATDAFGDLTDFVLEEKSDTNQWSFDIYRLLQP